MTDDPIERGRARYEAPRVTVVSLRPEEAVLGSCKVAGQGGPSGPGCPKFTGGSGSCSSPTS